MYMDTDSFIMHIKTEDFYEDIAEDVEKRFDTSNYECNRPLAKGKNKEVIRLMKDELGGKIMTEFLIPPHPLTSFEIQMYYHKYIIKMNLDLMMFIQEIIYLIK